MSATSAVPAKKIVLLAGRGDHANLVYNFLAQRWEIAAAVLEQPLDRWELARRRSARLGLLRTAGQIVFRVGIVPLLALGARARRAELLRERGLNEAAIPQEKVVEVPSVNSPECLAALERLQPEIVIVAGTRILTEQTLAAAPAVFVNIHTGITPLYRGVHGGYWALAQDDAQNFGVTIHLVDRGIDTGGVLAQARVTATPRDNFTTYGLLQDATGLALLRDEVLPRLMAGERATVAAPAGASKLWSHPTAWEYLRNRITRKVK
jgi:folate-dependent phosphoribosylglycinamide formyltransferase PurN